MSEDLAPKLVYASAIISGTVRRGQPDSYIFQRSHGSQQVKEGPIIPQNPKTQRQQLQRIHLRASARDIDRPTEEQKLIFHNCLQRFFMHRAWSDEFKSQYTKINHYGEARYGCGLYSGNLPAQHVEKYGDNLYGDGFFAKSGDAPRQTEPIETEFPNINIDCFKSGP